MFLLLQFYIWVIWVFKILANIFYIVFEFFKVKTIQINLILSLGSHIYYNIKGFKNLKTTKTQI